MPIGIGTKSQSQASLPSEDEEDERWGRGRAGTPLTHSMSTPATGPGRAAAPGVRYDAQLPDIAGKTQPSGRLTRSLTTPTVRANDRGVSFQLPQPDEADEEQEQGTSDYPKDQQDIADPLAEDDLSSTYSVGSPMTRSTTANTFASRLPGSMSIPASLMDPSEQRHVRSLS